MRKLSFVEQHIVDCIRVAVVEARGEEKKAARLRAQGKLRLVCMSDEEVWELAGRTCCPPIRSIEEAYSDIRQTIAEYKATTDEWLSRAFSDVSAGSSR